MEKGEQFNFITLQDIVLTINQKYKSKVKEHFKSLPLQEQVVTAGLVMFFSYTKSNQKATIANLLPIVNREMLQKTSNKISLPELEKKSRNPFLLRNRGGAAVKEGLQKCDSFSVSGA